MKFACDVMLGALARWLRVCGVDVYYNADIDRSSLFRRAREEGRAILTRTHAYDELKEIPPVEILDSELVEEQLPQFFRNHQEIDPWSIFLTRCLRCNELLDVVPQEEIYDRLPPLVKEKARSTGDDRITTFKRCSQCDRLYWPGTHVDHMKAFLVKTLNRAKQH